MNKVVNFSAAERIYVTSDTHFNHDKEFIWKSRGYNSVAEHNIGLIKSINDTVSSNDILIHLGDWCLNTKATDIHAFHDTLNCHRIYLLWGNHNNPLWKIYTDAVNSVFGKDVEIYPFTLAKLPKFIFVGNQFQCFQNKTHFVCSHFPLLIWDYMKYGSVCLTGHSHNNCPDTNLTNKKNKILDVGIDVHKRPISLQEAVSITQNHKIVIADHHART